MTMGRRREKNLDLPPRMQQKGKAFYYVTSTKPRQWIALGSDLDEARKQWAILENGPRDESLVENLVDKWLNSDAFDQLAPSSRICYESVSKQVKAFFRGAHAADVKPSHVAQWMDEHKSRSQANLGRAVLSNVMAIAVRRGFIDRNPVTEIKRHNMKARDRYLTDAEYRAIREQAKAIKRPVRGLYLLCTLRGQPYSYATINTWWQEAREKAGIADAHFHDIRAKSATDAKRDGIDYQALLGHSTKAMSDRYIKIEEAQAVDVLQRKL